MGASDARTVRTFLEARALGWTVADHRLQHMHQHGIDMVKGMTQQKLAGRFRLLAAVSLQPGAEEQGKNPFVLDSGPAKVTLKDYAYQ